MAASSRIAIAVGICGQSNERGSVLVGDNAYPQAFASLRNSGLRIPIGPANALAGGWWFKLYDDMLDRGYSLTIRNGAIGSMSMILHAAGQIEYRTAGSKAVFARRASIGGQDRGFRGTLISPVPGGTGPVYAAKTANPRAAFGSAPVSIDPTIGPSAYDYILTNSQPLKTGGVDYNVTISGTNVTVNSTVGGTGTLSVGDSVYGWGAYNNQILAGTKVASITDSTHFVLNKSGMDGTKIIATTPADFSSGVIGTQVVDGDITWECIQASNPGLLIPMTEAYAGLGFDPFGILARLHEDMQRVQASRKIIYIQNGQADVASSSATYSAALQSVAKYFLNRGYEVMIGLTCWQPISTGGVNGYNNLRTGQQAALSALQADATFGTRVFAGADLYSNMGTTGPMSGGTFTGSISSGVLTVSALAYGALEVGQTIYSTAGAVLGVISSFGSGTGGTGTYNLTNGVTTASSTMNAAGAFLQYDVTHLNSTGAVGPAVGNVQSAGSLISAAFGNILPQR
jgi:hypothetical protein